MSVLVFVSCDSSATQEISAVVENPTYSANIKSVIDSKCVNCHSGGDTSPNLESYDEVKNATLNGNLVCSISSTFCGSNRMPIGSNALYDSTIATINNWLTDGCPQ